MVRFDELQRDVVQEISKNLLFLQDYISLRATCRHFYSSIPPTPEHLPLQLPWLFYPPDQQNRRFFNFSTNKFHHLSFPNTSYRQRECGSSKGWLVILDEKSLEIVLINPLKGLEQEKVQLPALNSFSNVIDFNPSRTRRGFKVESYKGGFVYLKAMGARFMEKIIISSTPLKDAGFVAVEMLSKSLTYYRSGGDFSWRFIDVPLTSWVDIMYHNELLYAVNTSGCIVVCNLKSDPPIVSIIEMQETSSQVYLYHEMYLVGSGDELFLVLQYFDTHYHSYYRMSRTTGRFDVFRIDRSEQLAQWIAVTDVGDRAFFVGQNESVCFMASEYRGCMGNCIYFSSNVDTMTSNYHLVEYDTGIYNLSDGTIESFPPCQCNLRPPPIWVTPNPY